jgi:hypothetical protein
MYDVSQIRPQPGWALCRTLKPTTATNSGILKSAGDMEDGKTTEAVAEVISVTPARLPDGGQIDPNFGAGDLIVIRDFLKSANPLGDRVGADRSDRVFLLHYTDALAVVSGTGVLGYDGEYHIG